MTKRIDMCAGLAAALAIAAPACGPTQLTGGVDSTATADAGSATDARNEGPADARPDSPDGATPLQCGSLDVVFRDFSASHPDFESFTGDEVFPGLVAVELGADGTPTYAHDGPTAHTTGPAEFAQWFHDTPGTNVAIASQLALVETSPGVYAYDSTAFFPIDGLGFGNEANPHNFHFTTELHTHFEYRGGESFTFNGDDDLWLFINGRLAIDLGGLHQATLASVDLDGRAVELGITPGNLYRMDIFHAERHTVESNFRIETTIDCFIVP